MNLLRKNGSALCLLLGLMALEWLFVLAWSILNLGVESWNFVSPLFNFALGGVLVYATTRRELFVRPVAKTAAWVAAVVYFLFGINALSHAAMQLPISFRIGWFFDLLQLIQLAAMIVMLLNLRAPSAVSICAMLSWIVGFIPTALWLVFVVSDIYFFYGVWYNIFVPVDLISLLLMLVSFLLCLSWMRKTPTTVAPTRTSRPIDMI